ncbi:MAG: SUMF1/EgtB/PvdO family nonheme iron enzyme [Aggregatilineales bacterium]
MPILDRKLRRAIIELLKPHLTTISAQQTLVDDALFDAPNLRAMIDYNANANQFTSHLVSKCDKYGEVEPGIHALVAILEELRSYVGVGQNQQIDALIADIKKRSKTNTPPPEKPEITPPPKPVKWKRSQFVAALDKAKTAIEAEKFQEAIDLLQKALTYKPDARMTRRLEKTLQVAERNYKEAQKQHEAIEDYTLISRMLKGRIDQDFWCEEFHDFHQEFPDFDPDNLAAICGTESIPDSDSTEYITGLIDWIDIPGKNYSIGKYPVTNAQYANFVEAGGYQEKRWWTELGWTVKQTENWRQPRYWTDSKWNGTDYPVVGVSWYEAVAFCLWLSELTGENITLPTSEQWQYAAQGDDGRKFPWGEEWDCTRCNNSVAPCRSDGTTPVTAYEGKGDSPFGVVDMTGSVWEWSLNLYDNRKYILRGGSYYATNLSHFRLTYQAKGFPDGLFRFRGFRVCRIN